MTHPTYGDVLGRDPAEPARDDIRATPDWTPVALPGRPGWWRHCVNGRQVDLPDREPPAASQPAADDHLMPPRQCAATHLEWVCQRALGHSGRHTDTTGGQRRAWTDDLTA